MEILRHSSSPAVGAIAPLESAVQSTKSVELDLEDLFCILQIEPNDSIIAMELARRLNAMGRAPEAVRILKNVVDIDYRFETLSALGHAEYQADLQDDALEHLNQAVLVSPGPSALLFEVFKTLGNIHTRRGDLDLAEDHYHRAHRLNAASDVLHVNLGTLAIQRHQWDDAHARFSEALTLNPANDRARVGLSLVHRAKGDVELAWGNLESALELNPLNEAALGLALDWGVNAGSEARVLEFLRDFLVEGGWNERFSLAFAYLSARRGDVFLARLELERVLAVNPENKAALEMMQSLRVRA